MVFNKKSWLASVTVVFTKMTCKEIDVSLVNHLEINLAGQPSNSQNYLDKKWKRMSLKNVTKILSMLHLQASVKTTSLETCNNENK